MRRPRAAYYKIQANRDLLQLSIDDNFWITTARPDDRTTSQVDFNIATVVEEIRAALYFIAAADAPKH